MPPPLPLGGALNTSGGATFTGIRPVLRAVRIRCKGA
jgi:hypothetical protein